MTVIPDIVFLDRDGTINRKAPEGRYVVSPAEVVLLPGAAAAVRRLNELGVPVVVVSNQRGVALGRMTGGDVDRVNAAVAALLAEEEGAVVDRWLVCPHAVDACECRKPGPGLLLAGLAGCPGARADRCVVLGDSETDMLAGRAAGVRGVLLADTAPGATVASAVCRDLGAAVAWVLRLP